MTRTATLPSMPREESAPDVKLDVVYPQSPERVWRALTDPRQLGKWLLPNDFAPRLGHRFTFRERRGRAIRCEVVALEVERRLAYTWRRSTEEETSIVTWTLEPAANGGTRVRVTHTGLQACASPAGLWTRTLGRTMNAGRQRLLYCCRERIVQRSSRSGVFVPAARQAQPERLFLTGPRTMQGATANPPVLVARR